MSDAKRPTLSPLVHQYVRERRARGEMTKLTAKNYTSTLLRFAETVGQRPLSKIAPADVERWLETRQKVAASTRRAEYARVAGFAVWLRRKKLVGADLLDGVARPRQPRSVPRALQSASVSQLLEHLPDARAHAIAALLVGMGLRCVEVERLQMGDWDRQAETMIVTGKGGHQRILPVPAETRRALERYLAEWPARMGPLIRSYADTGVAMGAQTISRYMSKWMRAAGVKQRPFDGVAAHALRHTAASDVLETCGDLRVVQEMLGHQHLSSTSIYLRRASMTKMRDAMAGRDYRSHLNPPDRRTSA